MAIRSQISSISWKILAILITLCFRDVTSIWEYAVCTEKNIIFYDAQWNEVAEAASGKLGDLKTITYDTTHDVFYFTDKLSKSQTNINTLKLKSDGSTKIKTLIQLKDPNLIIEDLVYDFNDDALFYSDRDNSRIMRVNFDRVKSDNVTASEEVFLSTSGNPYGLELDACNRNLYFTTKSEESNINVVSIKAKSPKPVCNEKHKEPTAIALDERNDRIYITDKDSKIYYIKSFTTDGDDFRVDLKRNGRTTPRSLAVDHEYVYYLDGADHELRRMLKHSETNNTSQFFMKFENDPKDVIVRSNFIDAITINLSKCDVTKERMEELRKISEKIKDEEKRCTPVVKPKTCLHGGFYDERSSSCICKDSRYDGSTCEIDLCYNFCLNSGECSMEKDLTSRLVPTCSCTIGFDGRRCEHDICSNYCLNSGKCFFNERRQAVCECNENFSGKRCEIENIETKPITLDIVTQKVIHNPTTTTTESTTTLDDLPLSVIDEKTITKCPVRVNLTYVILAICLTLSLLFFLIILLVIKRFHKPMRPRIRKKFVVHKNIEPMTYRPTTEQCEVIIEDCCNMNICDTPCFDPKVLQQEINENNIKVKLTTSKRCGSSTKDDKQDLLKNMELNQ